MRPKLTDIVQDNCSPFRVTLITVALMTSSIRTNHGASRRQSRDESGGRPIRNHYLAVPSCRSNTSTRKVNIQEWKRQKKNRSEEMNEWGLGNRKTMTRAFRGNHRRIDGAFAVPAVHD
jgi:hypothetical protein